MVGVGRGPRLALLRKWWSLYDGPGPVGGVDLEDMLGDARVE